MCKGLVHHSSLWGLYALHPSPWKYVAADSERIIVVLEGETTNPLIILTYRVISSVISIRGFEARIDWPTDFCDATDSKKSNLKKALIWSLRRIMLSFLHQLYTGWDHGGAVFPVVKVAISTAGHGLLFSCGSGGTWQGVTIEFPEKALNGLDVWQSQRWPFQQPFLQTSMVCYGGVARGNGSLWWRLARVIVSAHVVSSQKAIRSQFREINWKLCHVSLCFHPFILYWMLYGWPNLDEITVKQRQLFRKLTDSSVLAAPRGGILWNIIATDAESLHFPNPKSSPPRDKYC